MRGGSVAWLSARYVSVDRFADRDGARAKDVREHRVVRDAHDQLDFPVGQSRVALAIGPVRHDDGAAYERGEPPSREQSSALGHRLRS
jgi:hypothetical protein